MPSGRAAGSALVPVAAREKAVAFRPLGELPSMMRLARKVRIARRAVIRRYSKTRHRKKMSSGVATCFDDAGEEPSTLLCRGLVASEGGPENRNRAEVDVLPSGETHAFRRNVAFGCFGEAIRCAFL